jgi:hypothetical protein
MASAASVVSLKLLRGRAWVPPKTMNASERAPVRENRTSKSSVSSTTCPPSRRGPEESRRARLSSSQPAATTSTTISTRPMPTQSVVGGRA